MVSIGQTHATMFEYETIRNKLNVTVMIKASLPDKEEKVFKLLKYKKKRNTMPEYKR